jgi:multidrug efflux pump subunit AcrB
VALINDSHKDPLTRSRINGEKSVTLAIQKRSGENILRVTDEAKRVLEEMRPLFPPALKIDLTSDMSHDVRLMVSDREHRPRSHPGLGVIFVFIGTQSAVFISLASYWMFITLCARRLRNVSEHGGLFSLVLALVCWWTME